MAGPLDHLDLPNANTQPGRAVPKPLPHQLTKEEQRKSTDAKGKAFRDAVWTRDRGRCRATGVPLKRAGVNWDEVGEVDHVIDRSLAPERMYDVSNGILISRRLNRLKKVACPRAPEYRMFAIEGPEDRGVPQRFTWRDADGRIVKEVTG